MERNANLGIVIYLHHSRHPLVCFSSLLIITQASSPPFPVYLRYFSQIFCPFLLFQFTCADNIQTEDLSRSLACILQKDIQKRAFFWVDGKIINQSIFWYDVIIDGITGWVSGGCALNMIWIFWVGKVVGRRSDINYHFQCCPRQDRHDADHQPSLNMQYEAFSSKLGMRIQQMRDKGIFLVLNITPLSVGKVLLPQNRPWNINL